MSQEQTLENLESLESIEVQESAELLQAVEAETQQEQQSEAADMAAQQGAEFAVDMVETLVKMRCPYVVIEDGTKEAITDKAIPVFRKYGGELPEWLQPYREEIELGMVLAVAGVGIYGQVKQHEAEQEKKNNEPEADQSQYAA